MLVFYFSKMCSLHKIVVLISGAFFFFFCLFIAIFHKIIKTRQFKHYDFLDISVFYYKHKKCLLDKCTLRIKRRHLPVLIQFSSSIMSDCLQPHRLQHARLPCLSPTSRTCSRLRYIDSVMESSPLILLLSSPPAFDLFQH